MSMVSVEDLLYRSEGVDLEFKSKQYRLSSATEHEKSELLKDVLAMANSWRSGTGYILVGVKENGALPAVVVGVDQHLDDASLQQFINGKVTPSLNFAYFETTVGGMAVGVFEIPLQVRPFYLTNKYGSLKSNVVYVRRGSSTAEAEPPEIGRMLLDGKAVDESTIGIELLDKAGMQLASGLKGFQFLAFGSLPTYSNPARYGAFEIPSLLRDNSNYWVELARYARIRLGSFQFGVRVTNRSAFALSSVKLEASVKPLTGQGIAIACAADLPEAPKRQHDPTDSIRPRPQTKLARQEMEIVTVDGWKECHARLGMLLPSERASLPDKIAVLPSGGGLVRVRVRILAAELPKPIESEWEISIEGSSRRIEAHELRDLEV